jgi:1,4-dihydroxy-2-naphthoyl-CoA synthase
MEEAKQGGILMAYGNLKVEKEGNIALLIIDRPELKNALNLDLLESISQAFTDLEQDKGVNAVVLTGSDEVFCAGFDMNTVMNLGQDKMQKVDSIEKAFLSVLRYPMPVIAAVSGPAIAPSEGSLVSDPPHPTTLTRANTNTVRIKTSFFFLNKLNRLLSFF